jgi:predicted TIM-barrel fold metal-dependent hydrolase
MEKTIALDRSGSAKNWLSGIQIVDVDTHISEWYDLWTSRAPAAMKSRVPQVRRHDNGVQWVIEGDRPLGMNSAHSAIRKDGTKVPGMGFLNLQNADVHAGSYDVKARLALMDEQGIQAQVAYPNALGFGGQKAMMVDADLRLLSTQIYNDAMAEMQADSGNRIYPMALLPWWDPQLAAAEAIRCNDMGLRGININPDPHNHGLPPLGDSCWDPLWKVCCDRSLPANFHIGSSDESATWVGLGRWPTYSKNNQLTESTESSVVAGAGSGLSSSLSSGRDLAYGSVMMFVGNLRIMLNILLDGFLDRFPELKIVSVESGIGWVPFLLETLAYQSVECGIDHPMSVEERFRRNIYACSWFERKDYVHQVRSIGVDNVMFETDFPHPTCLYPDPLQYLSGPLGELTFDERYKVLGGNAKRIYNLDLQRQ